MKNQRNETCPLCSNHCPADNLKCGKGHAHFKNGSKTTEMGEHHSHRRYRKGFGDRRREHFRADLSKDSLPYLLFYSSHSLHEMLHERSTEEEQRLFACLDETERNQLKMLLQKLLTHWEECKRKTE